MPSAAYLDYNATAPLRPEVRERMLAVIGAPHNASSVHRYGREAKKLLEEARVRVAAAVSAFPQEIVFTASGTEANNFALSAFPGRRILASTVEHPSVLRAAPKATPIPVDGEGVVLLPALDALLAADAAPAVVSVMMANNETGVIQPIEEIATLCKARGALLHCDAAQALGRIPVDFGRPGADMLTLTAHKCGGPVGAAALVVKTGLDVAPLLRGGAQESNRRAGTENIAAIIGFATACELAGDLSHATNLRAWMTAMEEELESFGGALVLGKKSRRLPNTSCISMAGGSGEVQLMHFDLSGIAVSSGSACSSGRVGPSHVLSAMNVPERVASCAIRVSAGWGTTRDDIIAFINAWEALFARLHPPKAA